MLVGGRWTRVLACQVARMAYNHGPLVFFRLIRDGDLDYVKAKVTRWPQLASTPYPGVRLISPVLLAADCNHLEVRSPLP